MVTKSRSVIHEDPLLTESEAAEYLRITPRQLYNWRMGGYVPFMRIGKALRYRKSAIDQALARFTRGGGLAGS